MKEKTVKMLVYAVIFLGMLTIATFSTIGYHIYSSKKSEQPTIISGNNAGNYNGRYFRDKLNLNNEQMLVFREINREFRSSARDINLKLISQRKQMMQEMQRQQPDTSSLNALSDTIGELHSEFKKHSYRYYLSIRSLCSEDQVKELDKIFEAFFTNDTHFNRQGQQGNFGQHRYGRQRNN